MWIRFYIEDKVGESIIDRIPHCHAENALKGAKTNKCEYVSIIEDKIGVSVIDIILHCPKNALYLRSSNEMRPKAAFRCGWNRRPIHCTSEKLSALSDAIYTVSYG